MMEEVDSTLFDEDIPMALTIGFKIGTSELTCRFDHCMTNKPAD